MTEFRGETIVSEGRKLEPDFYLTALTPLEHAMIGSSIEVAGENLSPSEIIKKNQEFLLQPLGLRASNKDSISKERENRFLEGYLPIFSPNSPLLKEGYIHRLRLPEIEEGGQIDPNFVIQLLKYNPTTRKYELVKDQEVFRGLEIVPQYENLFSLEGPFNPLPRVIETPWTQVTFNPQK